MEMIEKSIFILCIDKSVPVTFNHSESVELTKVGIRDNVNCALQLLHGMGSEFNGANRWYDKTMQFVISSDGNCGLNYEHSVAEGIAVIRLIEHILDYMEEIKSRRLTRLSSVCDLAPPKKLEWKIDKYVSEMISEAKQEIKNLADNLDIYILRYQKFGREFPKTVNMSPDSFIQLALQLTHYKIHKCLVPTYESASIRRFSLGRVDNIRAASIPALKWCTAMNGDIPSTDDEKIILLRSAMEWQTKVMLDTILGHGVDNHLLGLKEAAVELNIEIPELFKDKTYLESNRFRLSTSQVPTLKDAFMCYGAVVEHGYGAAYNPHQNYIVVAISCWCNCPDTRADVFAQKLKESFDEMRILLTSNLELAKNRKAARIQEIIMEESCRSENLLNHTFEAKTANDIGNIKLHE
nr:choline acetyltransferase [Dugesia japonica]